MHHDYKFATERNGLQDIFLNTPNQAAWFERYLTDWTGPFGRLGRMTFRMKTSVYPGDRMVFSATVTNVETDDRGCGWVDLEVGLARGRRGRHHAARPVLPSPHRPMTTRGAVEAPTGSPDRPEEIHDTQSELHRRTGDAAPDGAWRLQPARLARRGTCPRGRPRRLSAGAVVTAGRARHRRHDDPRSARRLGHVDARRRRRVRGARPLAGSGPPLRQRRARGEGARVRRVGRAAGGVAAPPRQWRRDHHSCLARTRQLVRTPRRRGARRGRRRRLPDQWHEAARRLRFVGPTPARARPYRRRRERRRPVPRRSAGSGRQPHPEDVDQLRHAVPRRSRTTCG